MNQLNLLKPDISPSFGLLHINIASLNAQIADLKTVLARLKFNFDIIGISEHKIRKDMTPNNTGLPQLHQKKNQPKIGNP